MDSNLCYALEHSCSGDKNTRTQAESYLMQARSQQGCVQSLLSICTNLQVNNFLLNFSKNKKSPHKQLCSLKVL